METFLLAHLDAVVQLVILLIVGLLSFDRLRMGQKRTQLDLDKLVKESKEKWSQINDKVELIDTKITTHIVSVIPHAICPAEQAEIKAIHAGVSRLEAWMITFVAGKILPPEGK